MVDFLVIGQCNAIKYSNVLPEIRKETIRIGYNRVREFSNGTRFGNTIWFTSMKDDYPPELVLSRRYVEGNYKKFDKFDAININRSEDIPYDYDGVMGVPITFLERWNPGQFEIVSLGGGFNKGIYLEGVKKYPRLLIRRK